MIAQNKHKILIIDDEPNIASTIIDILETENPNYDFFYAKNGYKGIEVATQYTPDLIVTDWEMPSLSGIETIKQLKQINETAQVPIIMLTGVMTSSENLKTALNAGAIDFIRKPIDEIELTARINSMLKLSDSFKENIAAKNRELTSTAMNIVRNNEFHAKQLSDIQEILNSLKNNSTNVTSKLLVFRNQISNKIKDESWTQFETYFNNVNPEFFERLIAIFPDLSPAELKLAAFLKLKLTTKEIAAITFLAPGSVRTARNRLRRKLKLDDKENITTFLLKI